MLKIFIAFAVISLLTSCANKTPDCSDPETQKLVIAQAGEKIKSSGFTEDSLRRLMTNYLGLKVDVRGKTSDLQFSLEKIAPFKYDKDVDKHFCKANLVSAYAGDSSVIGIDYTSQKVNGGKTHLVEIGRLTNENIGELISPLLKDISKEQSALTAKFRSQIGDENIDVFIEKKCGGLDKDEKQCAIGQDIKRAIDDQYQIQRIKLTQALLDDREKLVATYNSCVAVYKKNRVGMNVEDPLKKANPKMFMECHSAYMAAVSLGVKGANPSFSEEIGK
jgi:hypothetical protein